MSSVSSYLDNLRTFLERWLGPISAELPAIDPSGQSGGFKGVVFFPDGCELHLVVTLLVDPGSRSAPRVDQYSIHLQDRHGRCVIRFDNSPHHPQVATFPQHAHVGPGEIVQPHRLTTWREIARLVLGYHDGHQRHI